MSAGRYGKPRRKMAPLRRVAAILLESGATVTELSRELGVSRVTASKWASATTAWTDDPPAGGQSILPAELTNVLVLLRAGATAYGFPTTQWTPGRAAVVVEDRLGIVCTPLQVWRVLYDHQAAGVFAGG